MNYLKTGILLIVLTLLLVWIGGLLGGRQGAMVAFAVALAMNGISYWFSDKIVLAMYGAKEVQKAEYPALYQIVGSLTASAGLPMPKIFMIDNGAPNAFATGRDPKHACVCVTKGILGLLEESELKGVLAHELAHVKNRDTLIMTVTAAIAGAIMMLADMARWAAIFGGGSRDDRREGSGNGISLIALSIIAPIAALIIQLAISRSREYGADTRGAMIAHSKLGLISALQKLDSASRHFQLNANPQTAHLFIVNPFRGNAIANLFSTHPPIADRVEKLKALSI